MAYSYTPRTWLAHYLTEEAAATLPLEPGPFSRDRIVELGSPRGEELEQAGLGPIFYFDYEQIAAGLPEHYSTYVEQAAEDFTLPDGTAILKGALVLRLLHLQLESGLQIILFEHL